MNNISLVLLIIAFVVIFYALFVVFYRKKKVFSEKDIRFFRDRWARLDNIVSQDPRFVILEVDKLLDRLLTLRGYDGTLGEKLRKSEHLFSDIHGIWRAHKMRNFVAHEIDHSVSVGDARTCLRTAKIAFRDLGIYL